LLTANNIFDYVFDTLPCPLTTIGTHDTAVENAAFLNWKCQDNYVLLVLFGISSPEAQIVMFFATSSTGAMLRVTNVYANRSRT